MSCLQHALSTCCDHAYSQPCRQSLCAKIQGTTVAVWVQWHRALETAQLCSEKKCSGFFCVCGECASHLRPQWLTCKFTTAKFSKQCSFTLLYDVILFHNSVKKPQSATYLIFIIPLLCNDLEVRQTFNMIFHNQTTHFYLIFVKFTNTDKKFLSLSAAWYQY